MLESFARHLASTIEVNLAVRKGPLREIARVRVLPTPRLSAEELPQADVVIGGLAQPDPERVLALPASRGKPLFVFQGYGTVGNPPVTKMLQRRPRVLAVSSFLAEGARSHGCATELTRPGLDRSIFHPGPPCEEREPIVAMVAHGDEGKAMRDGLQALAYVRAAVPEAKLVLFGRQRPDGDAHLSYLGELSRPQVAALLRRVCVFVCPSLEEGLGLPGIEALACGAALASTDTKGSRDYALHEQTALVSAPGDPAALAENVIHLLRKRELRARLCRSGSEHVLSTYPPWAEAAAGFHSAIGKLLSLNLLGHKP